MYSWQVSMAVALNDYFVSPQNFVSLQKFVSPQTLAHNKMPACSQKQGLASKLAVPVLVRLTAFISLS